MSDAPAVPEFGNFIDGAWRPSGTGRSFASHDPADARVIIGRFAASDAADVAAAVLAASDAFPSWRRTPAPRRGELLYAFAALLAEHKERLARALTAEMGKILPEARGDVQEAIDIAYLMAGEGRRLFGDTVPSELPEKWAMSVREPIGVAGLITPWNFPIAIPAWKMMPALIAGNTVVWKPASDTPHCAVLFVELLARAGLPPGVVNLVTGSGEEAGVPLVTNPDVPVLSFTGNGDNGRHIAGLAARRLKRVSLELGGKNGIIVLADADLDLAVEGIVWSAFGTTGQRCTACSRVIVEASVADALVERLAGRAASLRLGHGLDGSTDVGPLINAGAVEKVSAYAALAGRDGQRLVTGGAAVRDEDRLAHGNFFAPTIVDHVQPMSRLGQEEVFGPLLSIIRVTDYDAAVTALNQTPFGLSAAIFTRDVQRAFQAMHDLQAGLVYINAGTIGAETHLPFGGTKGTGNGHREAGHAALDTFTEWKSIYVDYSGRLQRAQIDNQPA
ncbi:MAG: aldehyde dehydrogenase family protein [Candidatus Limnocylindrales bacterium]